MMIQVGNIINYVIRALEEVRNIMSRMCREETERNRGVFRFTSVSK